VYNAKYKYGISYGRTELPIDIKKLPDQRQGAEKSYQTDLICQNITSSAGADALYPEVPAVFGVHTELYYH